MPETVGTLQTVQREVRVEVLRDAVATSRTEGVLHARELDSRRRRHWLVEHDDAGDVEVAILDQLWLDTAGGVLAMLYTPPNELTALPVKFVEDALEVVQLNATTNRTRIHIREEVT